MQKLLLEGDMIVEDAVEGAVVDGAADEEHGVGVGLPSVPSVHPCQVRRFRRFGGRVVMGEDAECHVRRGF